MKPLDMLANERSLDKQNLQDEKNNDYSIKEGDPTKKRLSRTKRDYSLIRVDSYHGECRME